MDNKEFSHIRQILGKTQEHTAQILCVSPKAIQSFEQGWRHVPAYVERQLLLLLSLKRSSDEKTGPCWEIRNCPNEWRDNCIVWEFKVGQLCLFTNGTFCQGKYQGNWEEKMKLCRQCEMFELMLSIPQNF